MFNKEYIIFKNEVVQKNRCEIPTLVQKDHSTVRTEREPTPQQKGLPKEARRPFVRRACCKGAGAGGAGGSSSYPSLYIERETVTSAFPTRGITTQVVLSVQQILKALADSLGKVMFILQEELNCNIITFKIKKISLGDRCWNKNEGPFQLLPLFHRHRTYGPEYTGMACSHSAGKNPVSIFYDTRVACSFSIFSD